MTDASDELAAVRAEIDAIDDQLHDLLMQRAALAQRVGRLKGDGPAIRPAREARLLRRLIGRHEGPFPRRVLVSLWREIFGALSRLQGPFSVAVHAPDTGPDLTALARAHYGGVAPIICCKTVSQVISAVNDGQAAVGVVPVPREDDTDPWWRNILSTDNNPPRISARLPFTPRDDQGQPEALALARVAPEESGQDRSYVVIEVNAGVSRARQLGLLAEFDLEPRFFAVWEPGGNPDVSFILIEVDGFVTDHDARLEQMTSRHRDIFMWACSIGAYAVPLDSASLKDR